MGEFQLIQQIQQQTRVSSTGVKLGIGDDAAVLEIPAGHHLVAATDTLNIGVHFPDNTSPFDIGYKCLAVNLSDLAAIMVAAHFPHADDMQPLAVRFNRIMTNRFY